MLPRVERLIEHPHGVLAIVDDVIAPDALHPEEIARAEDFRAIRRTSFIAGRSALAVALAALGLDERPSIGSNDRGAPVLPSGYVGSVSHKGGRAVALAAEDAGFDLGVDVELLKAPRPGLEKMVLTDRERGRLEDPLLVLASFSIKEAVYKAIDPRLRRYVSFQEAELELTALTESFTIVAVSLTLAGGEPAGEVIATVARIDDHIIATARATR